MYEGLEPDESAFLDKFCPDEDFMLFDIGASKGRYFDAVRRPREDLPFDATLFEPRLEAWTRLLHKYGGKFVISGNVVINHLALGAKDSWTALRLADDVEHSHCRDSIVDALSLPHEWVQVYSLDTYLRDYGGRPIFAKIDTEGFEIPILEGAQNVLDKFYAIQFEYGGCWSSPLQTVAKAASLLPGFKIYHFEDGEVIPLDLTTFVDDYYYRNYIAVKEL